jgi:hypothetical protein
MFSVFEAYYQQGASSFQVSAKFFVLSVGTRQEIRTADVAESDDRRQE